METYDWIILGGGCSGLLLANHLSISKLKGRILILEKSPKTVNDRTWCYWNSDELANISSSSHNWNRLNICSLSNSKSVNMKKNSYRLIRSSAFYEDLYKRLHSDENITIKYESVNEISSNQDWAEVKTNSGTYRGKWLFNSLIQHAPIPPKVYHGLKQHFHGYWIKTEKDIFDSETFTLMDFSVSKKNEVQFVYVLPISKRKALVEYTVFSTTPWTKVDYTRYLDDYIKTKIGVQAYEIEEEESGIIPMSTEQFTRVSDYRIIHIGTAGGLTKASTGYTFYRAYEDSLQIAQNLKNKGIPFPLVHSPKRFKFYDRLLIYLILNRPDIIPEVMFRLFLRNPVGRTFKFLSEKTSLLEEVSLFFSLPWPPFLKALWHEYFSPKSKASLGHLAQPNQFGLSDSQLTSRDNPSL